MKGVFDGGIFVFYFENCFFGFDMEFEEFDVEIFKKYIFGGYVVEYMEIFVDDDEECYKG